MSPAAGKTKPDAEAAPKLGALSAPLAAPPACSAPGAAAAGRGGSGRGGRVLLRLVGADDLGQLLLRAGQLVGLRLPVGDRVAQRLLQATLRLPPLRQLLLLGPELGAQPGGVLDRRRRLLLGAPLCLEDQPELVQVGVEIAFHHVHELLAPGDLVDVGRLQPDARRPLLHRAHVGLQGALRRRRPQLGHPRRAHRHRPAGALEARLGGAQLGGGGGDLRLLHGQRLVEVAQCRAHLPLLGAQHVELLGGPGLLLERRVPLTAGVLHALALRAADRRPGGAEQRATDDDRRRRRPTPGGGSPPRSGGGPAVGLAVEGWHHARPVVEPASAPVPKRGRLPAPPRRQARHPAHPPAARSPGYSGVAGPEPLHAQVHRRPAVTLEVVRGAPHLVVASCRPRRGCRRSPAPGGCGSRCPPWGAGTATAPRPGARCRPGGRARTAPTRSTAIPGRSSPGPGRRGRSWPRRDRGRRTGCPGGARRDRWTGRGRQGRPGSGT